jgi:hypothetical protein
MMSFPAPALRVITLPYPVLPEASNPPVVMKLVALTAPMVRAMPEAEIVFVPDEPLCPIVRVLAPFVPAARED